ncbi:MAG TPA: hypothetical protein VFS15_21910 [Kofleriaceae bacterium]|nr:hypothetical protein [Kofleriaceae bacterium]
MSERWRRLAAPSVALLALLGSVIGIVNKFAYDDHYIIELSSTVHALHDWWREFGRSYWPKNAGGDGYRPLTVIAYKVEWAIGHGSPIAFHAANILLYAATSVLVYVVARRMLPLWAAWLVAALFAVHPVHVEAVANVVGQSELLVALAVLGATLLYLRDRQSGPLRVSTAVWILVLYALGCLSKEHAVVLPALLVAAEVTVIADRTATRDRVLRLRPFYLAMLAVALAFIAVRSRVLADHSLGGFEPFLPFSALRISAVDRALTAVGVVPQWIRLLYWPARLSADYGPPQIDIAQGPSILQLPGLLLLVGILAIGVVVRKRQPVVSFGIAIICITLLPSSNFILPAGIVLAERTLFLPSLGAMLIVGATVMAMAERLRDTERGIAWAPRARVAAQVACGAALVAGTARSATRTTAWRDNETLFKQSVRDAPNSYRTHYVLGSWYLDTGRKGEGIEEYRTGLALFPYDPYLAFGLGEAYRHADMCGPALPLYKWAHQVDPEFPIGRTQYALCLYDQHHYDEARQWALAAVKAGGVLPALHDLIRVIDSSQKAQRFDRARNVSVMPMQGPGGKLPDTVQKPRLEPVSNAPR